MKKEVFTLSAPYVYTRCLNDQCAQGENCLRRLAALYDTSDSIYISIINPVHYPADDAHCPYFQTTEKFRAAWGVKHLLDAIPYKEATEIKRLLVGHFGKTRYYRFYREEYYLTPQDQAYIQRLFRKKGIIEEPAFERYTDEYKW